MKFIYGIYVCFLLGFCPSLFAQEEKQTIKEKPASIRGGEITSSWVDRSQVISGGEKPEGRNVLWYHQPAKIWEEALPLGNGKLGAMIFGGVADERIQLNEHSLWEGYPLDPNDSSSLQVLPEVRRLIFEGKNNEAVALATQHMLGHPNGVRPYQSLGELWFDTPQMKVFDYARSLDLSTAIHKTTFVSNGVHYLREAFISPVDGVLIIHFSANKKEQINFSLTLRRQQNAVCKNVIGDDNSLLLQGQLMGKDHNGLTFAAQVKAVNKDGNVKINNGIMQINKATEVILFISAATNYPGLLHLEKGGFDSAIDPIKVCAQTIEKASLKSYQRLKTDHIAEHQRLFNRVILDLGEEKGIEALPTDERLKIARRKKEPDVGLVSLFFQYGRYLLISSSRHGALPANLQGIWAWQMNPPWNADYHTNINLQMNYWPAEITNLSELHLPLFDLTEALVEPGKRSAKMLYGANGWVVHHLTDAWGYTAPADGPQGIWPMGAAWLCQHLWEHYTYTCDKNFLKERAYPIMKGAAEFLFDFLVEAPEGTACPGKLVTNPSYSPENSFFLPNGEISVFTYGATMDLEIIHDLLTHCIEACNLLNIDTIFKNQCKKTLEKLAPIRISPITGRIMEWAEDYQEVDPHHRHTSHLFGLHPGNQITMLGTPELAEAARKTLIARGDGGTGWGLAWKINMWNRLQDGDHAYKLLSILLTTKILPNLFDDHPPFQIDGNFGATAAIAEMLVQSQSIDAKGNYIIQLLPSLPSALSKGFVKGLCARGGFVVDMSWNDKKINQVRIFSKKGGMLHVSDGNHNFKCITVPGEIVKLDNNLNRS